jgi:CBS domain containing-hemolysin-like protein
MTPSILISVSGLAVLLAVSAFCSSSETAFFSLDPLRIRRIGLLRPALAARLQSLFQRPTQILSAVLITNTLVNAMFAALGYSLLVRVFPRHGAQIAVPVLTGLLLLFGEVGPKRAGLLYTDRLIRLYVPLLTLLIRITSPVRSLLEGLTRKLERHFRPQSEHLTDEEFESVVDFSREQGVLNTEELAMVKAIIALEDTRASDVMTQRVDLKSLDLEDPPADLPAAVRAAKIHYLPLYRGDLDATEGFLDARAFLLRPVDPVENARLPAFFVPESVLLSDLLQQFQSTGRRVALAVDEFGGVTGLVTRGDILEEISGDIYQELSKPRPVFQEAGPHRWLVDANIRLEELNRKLRLNLADSEADRLSGWLTSRLGHIPEPNETVRDTECQVTVLQTSKRRVTLAMIEKGVAP